MSANRPGAWRSLLPAREAITQGAAGYIVKPFSQFQVGRALRAALAGSGPD